MPVMGGFEKLSYRNLLYTAVTRARKLLILVGTEDKIERMVANIKRTRRYTCLRAMLKKEPDNEPPAAEPELASGLMMNGMTDTEE